MVSLVQRCSNTVARLRQRHSTAAAHSPEEAEHDQGDQHAESQLAITDKPSLLRLPNEIMLIVLSYIPRSDFEAFLFTCKHIYIIANKHHEQHFNQKYFSRQHSGTTYTSRLYQHSNISVSATRQSDCPRNVSYVNTQKWDTGYRKLACADRKSFRNPKNVHRNNGMRH